MTTPLWTITDLVAAAAGLADPVPGAAPPGGVNGVSIDTRTLAEGDLFVALTDQRDGHDFVETAFRNGAAAALVRRTYPRRPGDGLLVRVDDPLAALVSLGLKARARLAPSARVMAVTGSAGKTTTKEMLRHCCASIGPTHASERSYNNHWGVPLTLARMPAATRFAVLEIGMSHAGEIAPLTRMVRPHIAVVTTVQAVHLEHFASVAAIAEAKAEIFEGLLRPGGVAVIPRDNPHVEILALKAAAAGARIVTFGLSPPAEVRPASIRSDVAGSTVEAEIGGRRVTYEIAMPGQHIAANTLAVAAALDAAGVDVATALLGLAAMSAPAGRGARATVQAAGGPALLIDESYNANPAAMRAALETLATVPRGAHPRRVAVLGDMLELGADGPRLHRELAEAIDAAGVDLVFAAGPLMRGLYDAVAAARQGAWAATAGELEAAVLSGIRAGDVVMVKGSNGSRTWQIVAALKAVPVAGAKSPG